MTTTTRSTITASCTRPPRVKSTDYMVPEVNEHATNRIGSCRFGIVIGVSRVGCKRERRHERWRFQHRPARPIERHAAGRARNKRRGRRCEAGRCEAGFQRGSKGPQTDTDGRDGQRNPHGEIDDRQIGRDEASSNDRDGSRRARPEVAGLNVIGYAAGRCRACIDDAQLTTDFLLPVEWGATA